MSPPANLQTATSTPPDRVRHKLECLQERRQSLQQRQTAKADELQKVADYLGIADPYFRQHEGIAGAETILQVDASVLVNALPSSNERIGLCRSLAG